MGALALVASGLALAHECHAQGIWQATSGSLTDVRTLHTATLLPDGRVLVAGGSSAGVYLQSTEALDPATGRWTRSGTLGVGRDMHTATLLPDGRVLLAGGFNTFFPDPYLDSAELRDAATGRWNATAGLATKRNAHTATLLRDGKVLVVGGYNGSYLPSAEIYDPTTDLWGPAAPLAVARNAHTATLLDNGNVLVAGGYNGAYVAAAELYDPSSNSWSPAGTLANPRNAHTATRLPDGRVVVIGGYDGAFEGNAEVYDPGINSWSAAGSFIGRRYHAATLLSDGRVLVTGGERPPGSVADVEIWGPSGGGTFSGATSLVTARRSHTATMVSDGRVVVAGGADAAALASAEIWVEGPGVWSAPGNLAQARFWHSVTPAADGRVLAAAGCSNWNGSACDAFLSGSEVWSPSANGWVATGALSTARANHGAALLADGRVLVAGGRNGSGILASAEVWDPQGNGGAGSWSPTLSMAAARENPGTTLLADGRVLVVQGSGVLTAEIWDPVLGTWSSAGTLPTARDVPVVTLLADGRVLVSGGTTGANGARCDVWDPAINSWSQTGTMIRRRWYHTAALLADGRVLAAGGYNSSTGLVNADAEVWDPETGAWTLTGATAQVRQQHTGALLPDGRVLVVGGCTSAACNIVTSTAEIWDPATGLWTSAGSLPLGRDSLRATQRPDGRILVTGGWNANAVANVDLWQPRAAPPAGVANACYPVLGTPGNGLPLDTVPWPSGTTIVANGLKLRGCGQGSGGSTSASPGDLPVIRFSSLSTGSVWDGRYTRSRGWRLGATTVNGVSFDEVTFTVPGDRGLAPGPYRLQAVVNGVASEPRVVRLSRAHEKLYLHRENTLGAGTRDLCSSSPSSTSYGCDGGGHLVGLRSVSVCRTLAAPGQLEQNCTGATNNGRFVYPPTGFSSAKSVSGPHILRADLQATQTGVPAGRAYLFARIKRHATGCLVHETERLTSLDLGAMPTGTAREAILRTVIPPRATDSCSGPCETIPCASTVIPAGDRVRVELWIEVVTADANREIQVFGESPGSTAAGLAVLSPADVLMPVGPTALRVDGLSAQRLGERATISWRLLSSDAVSSMHVVRGDAEPVGEPMAPRSELESDPSYAIFDEAPPLARTSYRLEIVLHDGSIEVYGPVDLDPAPGTTGGCGCRGSDSAPAGVAGPALLFLLGVVLLRRVRETR